MCSTCYFQIFVLIWVANVDAHLRIAVLKQESSLSTHTDMLRGGFFPLEFLNKNFGGALMNGVRKKIEIVGYDVGLSPIQEIMKNISLGLDNSGNFVGDIHALVHAGGDEPNVVAIIREAQKIGLPNLHATAADSNFWSSANTFAFGVLLPFTSYAREPIRYASKNGLKTIAIIAVPLFFLRKVGTTAIHWAMDSDLQVIGPSVQWCEKWGGFGNVAPGCRILNGVCRCVDQEEVYRLGYKYNVSGIPSFYDFQWSAVDGGVLPFGYVNLKFSDFFQEILQDIRIQINSPSSWDLDVLMHYTAFDQTFIQALVQKQFNSKMLITVRNVPTWALPTKQEMGWWAMTSGQWHKDLICSDPLFGSSSGYVEAYTKEYGVAPNGQAAGTSGASMVLLIAIEKYLGSETSFMHWGLAAQRDSIRQAIGSVNDETMFGMVRFNRQNQNNGRSGNTWQLNPDANLEAAQILVLPSDVATDDPVLPCPTWQSRVGCPAGTFNTGSECVPCPKGFAQSKPTPGLVPSACTQCEAGTGTAETGLSTCALCSRGRRQDGILDAGICRPCAPGFEASGVGAISCDACLSGKANPTAGAHCVACQAGTFADSPQQLECKRCKPGEYSGAGSDVCGLCSPAMFQNETGQSSCKACDRIIAGSWSPRGASDEMECVCAPGSYYHKIRGCVGCVEGLECNGGIGFPSQKTGYSAFLQNEFTRDIDVFECNRPQWCPQGSIGTCQAGREGRSCGRRVEGGCSAGFAVGVTLAVVIGFHVFYCVKKVPATLQHTVSPGTLIGVNIKIFIFSMQIVRIYMGTFPSVPENLIWMASSSEAFMFRFTDVSAICNLGRDLTGRYAMNIIPPLLVTLSCVFLVMFTPLLHKIIPKVQSQTVEGTFNCGGQVIQILYVSMCTGAFGFLAAKQNPNGTKTLHAYSDVVFASTEHYALVNIVIFLVLVLVYVIGTFCIFMWHIWKFPKNIHNRKFIKRVFFLIEKWRPQCFFWSLILILRDLSVALVPIVVRTDQAFQGMALVCVILGHALLESRWMPYKSNANSIFDLMCTAICCMIVFGGSIYGRDGATTTEKQAMTLTLTILFSMLCVNLLASVAYAMWLSTPQVERKRQTAHIDTVNHIVHDLFVFMKAKGMPDGMEKWRLAIKNSSPYDVVLCAEFAKYANHLAKHAHTRVSQIDNTNSCEPGKERTTTI